MVISSPCLIDNKELTSPEQTAPGKDFLNPLIVDSLLKTIWSSMHLVFTLKALASPKQWAIASTDDNGEVKIITTIDGHSMTITKASLRRHLKLDYQDGITSIPNSEIFEQLALMGYHTESDKLTFQKGAFSPQWRFLIHNILHCLSPKKTAWEQFSSNIATAVICLATNRKYNFSRMIFEHMVSNISSPHKFLMYPRFIQICLDMQRNQLQQHSRTYPVPSLSVKVFNNMKRPTKGYSGQEVALFPTMLDVTDPSTSPSRITSSPSPSPEPSPSHSPEPSTQHSPDYTTAAPTPPSPTQPSPTQPTQPSPRAEHHFPTPHDSPLHVVHSHGSDEGSLKLNELTNLVTKLSDRIGVLEDDLRKTKKTYSSAFTKLILRVKKLESQIKTGKTRRKARIVHSDDEDIEDDSSKQGRKLSDCRNEKGSAEVSTAGATKGTASEVLVVSTAEENISTVTHRKSREELEQERLSFAEAIRLEEQMNEEQRAHIARDEEIARQPIFEKVWDFNQHIKPMEHGSEKMKSPKKIEEKDADTQKEVKEVVEEFAKDVESLSIKYPIVDWKTYTLTENLCIIKSLEEMAVPRTTGFGVWCLKTLKIKMLRSCKISQRKGIVLQDLKDLI
ncbi:hypothetical protein Tco_1546572 [Tanacetum coccineum]